LSPQVLVPLMPDMSSVVSVSSIDAFFDHNGSASPAIRAALTTCSTSSIPRSRCISMCAKFSASSWAIAAPLCLRRAPAVSEALAEGMTVMDYAPNSASGRGFRQPRGWVKSLSAPATTSFRGVRWSER
jgi:hypothetical protein